MHSIWSFFLCIGGSLWIYFLLSLRLIKLKSDKVELESHTQILLPTLFLPHPTIGRGKK